MVPTAESGRQKRVRDEAAAWHALMMEPTSEAEVTAFEHWLQADSAHAQAYEEVESISSLGERLPRRLLAKSSARTPARLRPAFGLALVAVCLLAAGLWLTNPGRSEEHTSELQSLMRISYSVFCFKKNKETRSKACQSQL